MRDLVVVFTVLVNLPGCSNPFSFFGVVKFSSSQVYPGFEVQSAGDVALTPGAARGDFFTKNQNYRLGGGEVGRFDVRTERLGIHILRAEGSEYDFRLTLGLDNREAEPISLNLSSVKLYSLVAATGSKDEAARPCHFVFQKEHGLGTIMLFAEKPSTEWSLRAASETGAGNDTYTAVTPEGEWEVFRDSSDKNLSILAKERAVLDIQVCGRFSKLVKGTLALECIGRGLIKYEFYMEARK